MIRKGLKILCMPRVQPLDEGLHEVRSNLPHGISRVIFIMDGDDMVLLHGFIKKNTKDTD